MGDQINKNDFYTVISLNTHSLGLNASSCLGGFSLVVFVCFLIVGVLDVVFYGVLCWVSFVCFGGVF